MIWILTALAVMILILAVPLGAEVYFEYSGEGMGFDIEIRICGIRLRLPDKSKKPKKKNNKKKKKKADGADESGGEEQKGGRTRRLLTFARAHTAEIKALIYAVLEYMRKHMIKIKSLTLRTVIGVQDAMETALIYGAESALVYNIVGVMDRHMRLCAHDIDLKPDFNNERLYALFDIDIRTNIFHTAALTIIVLRHALPLLRKFRHEN